MNPRIPTTALAAVLLAASLTACSAQSPAPAATAKATEPAATPTAAPVATETPAEPPADPACDTIVSEGTVTALTDAGWTFERKDFIVGDVSLPEGVLCFWADYTVATDHGQLYGWAAISNADAAKAQSSLLSTGWKRENAPEGSYFTENPEFSMGTDDEGYGMTYLFGDGWVKLSDTKQGLILISWP